MKTILSLNTTQKLKNALILTNYNLIEIEPKNQSQTLGYLLGLDGYNKNTLPVTSIIQDEMIVFYNFDQNDLDIMLNLLKSNKIFIPLKAIVTDYNVSWPLNILYNELVKERDEIKKRQTL